MKRSKRALVSHILSFLITLGPIWCGTESAAASEQGPQAFSLEDQFGRPLDADGIDGRVVVFIGSDRRGRDAARRWAGVALEVLAELALGPEDAEIVRVADLRTVRRAFAPMVRRSLAASNELRILLDWEGQLAGPFGFESGAATVVIVNRLGEETFRSTATEPSAHLVESFSSKLATSAAQAGRDESVSQQPVSQGID